MYIMHRMGDLWRINLSYMNFGNTQKNERLGTNLIWIIRKVDSTWIKSFENLFEFVKKLSLFLSIRLHWLNSRSLISCPLKLSLSPFFFSHTNYVLKIDQDNSSRSNSYILFNDVFKSFKNFIGASPKLSKKRNFNCKRVFKFSNFLKRLEPHAFQ